jgi:hypothetical protein
VRLAPALAKVVTTRETSQRQILEARFGGGFENLSFCFASRADLVRASEALNTMKTNASSGGGGSSSSGGGAAMDAAASAAALAATLEGNVTGSGSSFVVRAAAAKVRIARFIFARHPLTHHHTEPKPLPSRAFGKEPTDCRGSVLNSVRWWCCFVAVGN